MTDTMTKDTQSSSATPVSAPTPTLAPPQANSKAKSKPKSKSKPRRTRQRRRAADDSSGDEAGAGAASDSSLSSRSDPEASESEGEPASKPTGSKAKAKSAQPVFADASSITPTVWSSMDNGDDNLPPISFEDFNAGKEVPSSSARGTGLSIRGRGGKAKVEAGAGARPKREYTPEETAKYEAHKAKRKEKAKAKKVALKEEKLKGKEGPQPVTNGDGESAEVPAGPTEPSASKNSKPKGKKRAESAPTQDAAEKLDDSTAALALETPKVESKATPASGSAAGASAQRPQNEVEAEPSASSSTATRPPRQPRAPPRDTPAQRNPEDPKVTPRTGQFWTHDQRLSAGGPPGEAVRPINPFLRGRAIPRGAFRGVIRGRGRGGFFPNPRGFVNGVHPRQVELSQEENKEEGSSKLAMDREYELAEAREKARAAPTVSAPTEQTISPEAAKPEPAVKPAPVPPTQPSADRKWGHEGYEAMSAANQFRGGFRGRVRGARGRGGFFARGGGHLPFAPQNQPFHPAAVAARAAAAASRSASSPTGSAASTPAIANKAKPAVDDQEKMSTQPTADSLLDPADESVKIKFPGSAASVVPASAASPTNPSAPHPSVPAASSPVQPNVSESEPATLEAGPSAQAPPSQEESPAPPTSSEPQFPSMQSSSPAPVAAVQAQMYTGGSSNSPYPMGSENGSVGSAQFVQHSGQFYASGMTPNGEFVPSGMGVPIQQRPAFYPQQSHRSYPAQSPQFYPPASPYSPGPYDQHHHRGSFSGAPMASPQSAYFGASNGYANGRSSPLNPYIGQQAGGGYFVPVRGSSKVAIRAPAQSQTPTGDSTATNEAQGAEPHAGAQSGTTGGTYFPQHYNPYVQPFVPGQQQETVYYPTANGQQYAWQGYGEQAYYDGNAAYGY